MLFRSYALADYCPHQQSPLAPGRLEFMMTDAGDAGGYHLSEKQVLRCPWHGYEFDLESGCSPADPRRMRVKTYPVTVEDGRVVVSYLIRDDFAEAGAVGGVAGGTYIFALPGSPSACRDGWEEILKWQLDNRHRPCNLVELMPRLQEHLTSRPKATV